MNLLARTLTRVFHFTPAILQKPPNVPRDSGNCVGHQYGLRAWIVFISWQRSATVYPRSEFAWQRTCGGNYKSCAV